MVAAAALNGGDCLRPRCDGGVDNERGVHTGGIGGGYPLAEEGLRPRACRPRSSEGARERREGLPPPDEPATPALFTATPFSTGRPAPPGLALPAKLPASRKPPEPAKPAELPAPATPAKPANPAAPAEPRTVVPSISSAVVASSVAVSSQDDARARASASAAATATTALSTPASLTSALSRVAASAALCIKVPSFFGVFGRAHTDVVVRC